MSSILITETQLKNLKRKLEENKGGSYMAKQQLFTIATLATKMWESMQDGEQLEDWMESKIAQVEQSLVSVVKTYMYDEVEDIGNEIDFSELIIGR